MHSQVLNVAKVFEVSKAVPARSRSKVFLKLSEEVGELALEVAVAQDETYKKGGSDGIVGEAIDVIICAMDLIYVDNPKIEAEVLVNILQKKLQKWIEKEK
jgi:hypothetical protein